ncbi:hypothetical protein [Actinosynnema mirum]|uniref:pectate lyase family protein n=1 Tax=Actinosynnema mirum TaxID=40567 RepID=UPI00019AB30E|nr:hypothetical protein [Actinosynnema mirum]
MQNSINANPINQQFGAHTETGPFTWRRNLFANSHGRNPIKGNTQFVNNVVYNYQAAYTAGNSSGHFLHDVVGDHFITGPRTTRAANAYYQLGNQSLHTGGDLLDDNRDGALNGSALALDTASNKTLIGTDNDATDVGKLSAAFHHNWFAELVDQRMPRVLYGKGHVCNNCYTATATGTRWARAAGSRRSPTRRTPTARTRRRRSPAW